MPKQYLTVNEVARIFGVSPLTVRNWDQKGRLEAYRNPMNNYRLYKISDVEKLLEEIAASRGKKIFPTPIVSDKKKEKEVAEKIIPQEPRFKKLKIETE